jgi:membrane fusion protein, multidrug efflux system
MPFSHEADPMPRASHPAGPLAALRSRCCCSPPATAARPPPPPEIRPVRVATVERSTGGEVVSLTGTVQAETEVNLAFRIDGRMVERLVNVGDRCAPGRSSPGSNRDNEENNLRAARAALAAARGPADRGRQQLLAPVRIAARRLDHPRALRPGAQARQTAQAAVDAATAQVGIAETRLSYTELVSDAGRVTPAAPRPARWCSPAA